jgi:trehalose 6-phosphate synthase
MSLVEQPTAFESPLVVASNRGPVSFRYTEEGALVGERGSGGLVTALAGVLFESDATWLAAAMTDGDRDVAASGRAIEVEPAGHASFVNVPPELYVAYYNGVSNRILWLLHHYLFDLSFLPTWDAETRHIWRDYREVNRLFAEALNAERVRQPVYLVQDYQLSLVPRFLRELQPEARIAHFTHTPFTGPSYLRVLPGPFREDLLRGMLGADVLGFQAEPWAENFLLCVRDSLRDVRVDVRRRRIHVGDRTVLVRTYPVSLDSGQLRGIARGPDIRAIRKEIGAWRGDEKLLLRVDRLELSKNIVRGFEAYETFLNDHPEWHKRVRFLCLLPHSRAEIPEYQAYAKRCLDAVDRINAKFGDSGWKPVEVRLGEDYARAVAAYGLYDALLVNPIFDGMNLVAMEGPLVNRRQGALILSRNAGAYAILGRHAIPINPFDIAETADAIHEALEMPEDERVRRSRGLTRAILARSPVRWLTAQLRDLDIARGGDPRRVSERAQEVEQSIGLVHDEIRGGDELGGSF